VGNDHSDMLERVALRTTLPNEEIKESNILTKAALTCQSQLVVMSLGNLLQMDLNQFSAWL